MPPNSSLLPVYKFSPPTSTSRPSGRHGDGVYPEVIAADVSEERLGQFFVKDHGTYRLKPPLRGMVLFAVHDMLRDPPFSRLDLISCRNLLIYLHRNAQGKAFEIFHFALGRRRPPLSRLL